MTLEQQVCSLELAKRLKELGVKQESFFGWYFPNEDKIRKDEKWDAPNIQIVGSGNEWAWHDLQYSAFTVAELGGMLPWKILAGAWSYELETTKNGTKIPFTVYYHRLAGEDANETQLFSCEATTEADARGLMLIYLLENNLVTK